MINAPITTNHNITPTDLSKEQDVLLLAGSKLPFREIYNQELELPVYKGKYYVAEDVDNLFVLINGIFTDVSEQAFRYNTALTTAREDADVAEKAKQEAENTVQQYATALSEANQMIQDLQSQLTNQNNDARDDELRKADNAAQDLAEQLAEKSLAYTRLMESSTIKIDTLNRELSELKRDKDALETQNISLSEELQSLITNDDESNNDNTDYMGLQSQYDVLEYKYETLKQLSTQRIQDLTNQMTQLKELGNVK